jgi:hypothetical protein
MIEHSVGETTISTAELQRLQQLEAAAVRIWPAIRFFGLCGAEPEYVQAAMEIGKLTGKIPQVAAMAIAGPEVITAARREGVQAAAEFIEQSTEIGSKTGRGLRAEIAKIVREMAR